MEQQDSAGGKGSTPSEALSTNRARTSLCPAASPWCTNSSRKTWSTSTGSSSTRW
jgi:hypothetical protein